LAAFNCSPAAGSLFLIGATDVSCTATDTVGNVGSCSFRVFVLGARVLKTNVLAELRARFAVAGEEERERLEDAIEELSRSLAPGLWIDDDHLTRKGSEVFEREKEAVEKLEHLLEDDDDVSISASFVPAWIEMLVRADRLLAALAIHDAALGGASPAILDAAERELAEGDREAARGDFEDAIREYRDAWRAARRPGITGTFRIVDGMWRMDCMGQPGISCTIQATSDFVTWTDVHTSTLGTDGRLVFQEPRVMRARFFRVVPTAGTY
jgi:hypothetical protein